MLSNEYLSILLPLVIKNTSEELRLVLIPIVLIFLFVTYTFWGKSNVPEVGEVEIEIGAPLAVKTTFWLLENGWFSI